MKLLCILKALDLFSSFFGEMWDLKYGMWKCCWYWHADDAVFKGFFSFVNCISFLSISTMEKSHKGFQKENRQSLSIIECDLTLRSRWQTLCKLLTETENCDWKLYLVAQIEEESPEQKKWISCWKKRLKEALSATLEMLFFVSR